jgi:hypothetical protein
MACQMVWQPVLSRLADFCALLSLFWLTCATGAVGCGVCMNVLTYTCVYVHIYVCISVYKYMYTYVYVYACTCICMCIYIHV